MKNYKVICMSFMLCFLFFIGCKKQESCTPVLDNLHAVEKYNNMQHSISRGWNTWDTRSVLRHVLLPYGIAIDVNLSDPKGEKADRNFFIGQNGKEGPHLLPGTHSFDGYYTDITATWNGMQVKVESASEDLSNIIIITPQDNSVKGGRIYISFKTLWQRASFARISGNSFLLTSLADELELKGTIYGKILERYKDGIVLSADQTVTITCGNVLNPEEARRYMDQHFNNIIEKNITKYGKCYEEFNAMQNILGWNTIYDPSLDRIITPVSRSWNVGWSNNPSYGGFILFCWDTYFASLMLSVENKELAYANAVEMTLGITEEGFVPNFYSGGNYKSRDRSQPPVGSLAVWTIYQKYKEKWFLELLYDKLLRWNRWWDTHRKNEGLLSWGSSPYRNVTYRYWEFERVNTTKGGSLESGLDNTHMYDDVPFNKETHLQQLHDVGLNSLYIMDCKLLARIANELNLYDDKKELEDRSKEYSERLSALWDKKNLFYYNYRPDSKEFNYRTSPTNFYTLLAGIPSKKQAEEMIRTHLLNPREYWGEWVIPSTPRNDPAFKDNTYWRGRIWAPLNFLVYLGLRNYDTQFINKVRHEFAQKSKDLLLKSWLSDKYIFENYNATNGKGDDVRNSDKFYHWGALLGYISLLEEGFYFSNNSPFP